jgi:hypothetical protein
VTRSEFLRAISDEFGEVFGRSLLRDLVLSSLGERTADEALAAGRAPREVWLFTVPVLMLRMSATSASDISIP